MGIRAAWPGAMCGVDATSIDYRYAQMCIGQYRHDPYPLIQSPSTQENAVLCVLLQLTTIMSFPQQHCPAVAQITDIPSKSPTHRLEHARQGLEHAHRSLGSRTQLDKRQRPHQ